jgi:hypothetical protein
MTLKTTPAVAAGLTDHVWSVKELLEQAAVYFNTISAMEDFRDGAKRM